MGIRGVHEWQADTTKYSEEQIASVLEYIGVEICSETTTNYLCLCPYHGNNYSPAFSISKTEGLFMCFNASCEKTGDILTLIADLTKGNRFTAKRLLAKHKNTKPKSLTEEIEAFLSKKEALGDFDQNVLDRMYHEFWSNTNAQDYMINTRGFEVETLKWFRVGYSEKRDMIAVPFQDWNGHPLGVIGRSIDTKVFKNSAGLPTSKTLFNLHRAKRSGDRLILVESSFDAMKVHQAGFPCVAAVCGGFFTKYHLELINKYFNSVVIMTDFDEKQKHIYKNCKKCHPLLCAGHNPGRALGQKIEEALKTKRVRWASYEYGVIYPHNAKDAGDLTKQEIKQCIDNSISSFEYERWRRVFPELREI